MQEAIEKAEILIEAHHYIRQFAGKTVVVKVGGSIMDEPATLEKLLMDICFMDAVGIRPVIVHGGGEGDQQGDEGGGAGGSVCSGSALYG